MARKFKVGDEVVWRGTPMVVTSAGERQCIVAYPEGQRPSFAMSAAHLVYISKLEWQIPHSPTLYCQECDEDDAPCYTGDYLCAWCREHLEDRFDNG